MAVRGGTGGIAALVSGVRRRTIRTRPIKLIVVAPPGGTADNVARTLAAKMSERLGQQVVVENRPSNAGIVGYEMVARAPADGYTLVMATGTLSTVQALYPSVTFDAVKDFEPDRMGTDHALRGRRASQRFR